VADTNSAATPFAAGTVGLRGIKSIEDFDLKEVNSVEERLEEGQIRSNNSSGEKVYKMSLEEIDIYSLSGAKWCLRLNLSRKDKLECIRRFEKYILEEKPVLTLDDCKKLLRRSSKLICFDKVYFNI